MVRNETNNFHLESYSHINRRRTFDTLGDSGLWGHMRMAGGKSCGVWKWTKLSRKLDSMWITKVLIHCDLGPVIHFLTFNFHKTNTRTLTATLESPNCYASSHPSVCSLLFPLPGTSHPSLLLYCLESQLRCSCLFSEDILPPQDWLRCFLIPAFTIVPFT